MHEIHLWVGSLGLASDQGVLWGNQQGDWGVGMGTGTRLGWPGPAGWGQLHIESLPTGGQCMT